MQQDYKMLPGFGPGSGLNGKVTGNARGENNPVIANLYLTVTTCVMVLLKGSALKHCDALPASTLNHDSPS
jgi:hypothetical protein